MHEENQTITITKKTTNVVYSVNNDSGLDLYAFKGLKYN